MDRRVIALWAVIVLVLLPVVALAQQPTEATDVTREQIEAVRTAPEGGVDRQVKVVDIGKSNVAVGILHRNRGREHRRTGPGDRPHAGDRGLLHHVGRRHAGHRGEPRRAA